MNNLEVKRDQIKIHIEWTWYNTKSLVSYAIKQKEEKFLLDDKAKDFTARHVGWVYEIPAFSAKYMTMPLSDILEDSKETDIIPTSDPNAILNAIQQEDMP